MTGEVRDFLADMHAMCVSAVSETESPNPVVAAELVEKLRANDPELLTGWLNARAVAVLNDYLRHLDSVQRAKTRVRAPGRAFAEAARAFEAGEAPMRIFEARYVISDVGARRRVGDMTGADHKFVADRYGDSARRDAFLESVHRAVAAVVGDRRTEEVYSAEQYAAMFKGI